MIALLVDTQSGGAVLAGQQQELPLQIVVGLDAAEVAEITALTLLPALDAQPVVH